MGKKGSGFKIKDFTFKGRAKETRLRPLHTHTQQLPTYCILLITTV